MASTYHLFAQCTPDPSIALSSSGIYPVSAAGFASGVVGQPYTQTITVVVPADTIYSLFTVPVDSIGLQSYQNLPPGLTLIGSTPSLYWHGGTKGCALISGTPTTAGNYRIRMNIQYVAAGGLYNSTVLDTDYVIVISPAAGIESIEGSLNTVTATPNPFSQSVDIEYNSNSTDEVEFSVYNLVGKIVYQEKFMPSYGKNVISYTPAPDLPKGIYLYKLNNGKKVITKRIIYTGN